MRVLRNQQGRARWPLVALLAIVSTTFVYLNRERISEPIGQATTGKPSRVETYRNALALGSNGQDGVVDIAIQEPTDFDFKSRDEILRLRAEAVAAKSQMLARPYRPLGSVFGQIVDGVPWWGTDGQFYFGPGQHSIDGPSEEARFVLNPYLLVAPDFRDDWHDLLTPAELPGFQLYCSPHSLRWRPRDAYAEVTYSADCIAKRRWPVFDLIAYNARDFNLDYLYISYADSKNVAKKNPPDTAYRNPQFIHKGGSCGYPGGCNNMSPMTPPIDGLRVTGLPASVVVRLWAEQPASVAQTPDMTYVIHFE
jgi:hypothetical protein